MPLFLTLLLVSFPLVSHISIHNGRADLAVYFMASLLVLPMFFALLSRSRPAPWAIGTSLLALAIGILGYTYAPAMIVIPPILIFSSLMLLFGSSLRTGATPIITRFAELILGDVAPEVRTYTRKATIAWTLFFMGMLFCALVLGLWAPLELWSWFTNVIAYVLIGVMFVGEFLVRRLSLPHHVDYSFIEFIRNLIQVDFRHVIK